MRTHENVERALFSENSICQALRVENMLISMCHGQVS